MVSRDAGANFCTIVSSKAFKNNYNVASTTYFMNLEIWRPCVPGEDQSSYVPTALHNVKNQEEENQMINLVILLTNLEFLGFWHY